MLFRPYILLASLHVFVHFSAQEREIKRLAEKYGDVDRIDMKTGEHKGHISCQSHSF